MSEDIVYVKKGWGAEYWIANSPLYCGKKLVLHKGKRCSIHYHKIKDETFYIQSGLVRMSLFHEGYPGPETVLEMKPGEKLHIPVGLVHQFFGLEESVIFEFSTEHFDEDSYRHVKGD